MAKFSLKRKEEIIAIEGEDGVERNYIIRELSGAERDKFLNLMSGKMRYGSKGEAIGLKSFDGVESTLIEMSLIGPDGKPVTAKEIKDFPSSLQSFLFEKCQEISGLDKEAGQKAKNE